MTGSSDRLRRLYLLALVSVCGVVLTATHDGGAQWGPRFLLVSVPPLILLGACGATDAVGEGRWRALRIALVGLILVAGVATSRAAYRELRGAKRSYARAVMATAQMAPPGTHIVTNVWYLDQIAATLHDSRFFFYVPDRDSAARALGELSRANVRQVVLVSSLGDSPAWLDPVALDSCFKPVDRAGCRRSTDCGCCPPNAAESRTKHVTPLTNLQGVSCSVLWSPKGQA